MTPATQRRNASWMRWLSQYAPWLVILYLALGAILNPLSAFNEHDLMDSDDLMRFQQIFDWLNGQSWFDLTQYRLYPLHPVVMHWSRVADMLPAAIILIARFITPAMGTAGFISIAGFLAPLLLFVPFYFTLQVQARLLLGHRRTVFILPALLSASTLLTQFVPMRMDHNSYFLICTSVAFFALQGMALKLRPVRMGLLAALAFSAGLWIGVEILPILLLFHLALATLLVERHEKTLRAGLVFSLGLLFFTSIFLLLARGAHNLFAIEYDTLSFFYVIAAAFSACFFTSIFLLAREIRGRDAFIGAVIALMLGLGGLFLCIFPDFIKGPYAQANPLLDTLFFPMVSEATPAGKFYLDTIATYGMSWPILAGLAGYTVTNFFTPLLGLAGCLMALRQAHAPRQRMLWMIYGCFLTGFLLLTLFWEIRVVMYAFLFSFAPAAWLIAWQTRNMAHRFRPPAAHAATAGFIGLIVLFPVLIMPLIGGSAKTVPDALFLVAQGRPHNCTNPEGAIAAINANAQKTGKPAIILSEFDYTPLFMLYTDARFIAAPYHRNGDGIAAVVNFFRSHGDGPARGIVQKLDIDYVLLCKNDFPETLLQDGSNPAPTDPAAREAKIKNMGMALELAYGKQPAWLKPIDTGKESSFALYAVDRKAAAVP